MADDSNGHAQGEDGLLREIAALVHTKQRQDEENADLRYELGASDIQHRE